MCAGPVSSYLFQKMEGNRLAGWLFTPDMSIFPLIRPQAPTVNRFRGQIKEIRHVGGMAYVEVMVADQRVHAQMTTEQAQSLSLSPEDSVYGILKLRALHGC